MEKRRIWPFFVHLNEKWRKHRQLRVHLSRDLWEARSAPGKTKGQSKQSTVALSFLRSIACDHSSSGCIHAGTARIQLEVWSTPTPRTRARTTGASPGWRRQRLSPTTCSPVRTNARPPSSPRPTVRPVHQLPTASRLAVAALGRRCGSTTCTFTQPLRDLYLILPPSLVVYVWFERLLRACSSHQPTDFGMRDGAVFSAAKNVNGIPSYGRGACHGCELHWVWYDTAVSRSSPIVTWHGSIRSFISLLVMPHA